MRRSLLALAAMCSMALPFAASAEPKTGEPAPAFTVKDAAGKDVSLDALQGNIVVLEWSNFGCPFVKKHYGAGNIQALQKAAAKDGVIWLSVFSSAKGKEGYLTPEAAIAEMKKQGGAPAHILMDPDGTLGKLYAAKTTPHIYIIDKEGTLVYQGAIDDKPTADPTDIKGAKNYVTEALTSLNAGTPVAHGTTKPYGCSVKYAD